MEKIDASTTPYPPLSWWNRILGTAATALITIGYGFIGGDLYSAGPWHWVLFGCGAFVGLVLGVSSCVMVEGTRKRRWELQRAIDVMSNWNVGPDE